MMMMARVMVKSADHCDDWTAKRVAESVYGARRRLLRQVVIGGGE